MNLRLKWIYFKIKCLYYLGRLKGKYLCVDCVEVIGKEFVIEQINQKLGRDEMYCEECLYAYEDHDDAYEEHDVSDDYEPLDEEYWIY